MTTTPTNTRSQGGAEKLLPCPFCGAGESRIDHQNMWTGMRNQLVCVHIRHWCEKPSRSHLCITANTEEEAVAEWNKRTLAAPASAQEALCRLERAVDAYLGRSAWTQTTHLKGMAHSESVRKELYAAHDNARAALASAQPKTGVA